MASEVNEWDDDDPYCAHCGNSVHVDSDHEFNEGDLCNQCLYVEYPKVLQRAEAAEAGERRWNQKACELVEAKGEVEREVERMTEVANTLIAERNELDVKRLEVERDRDVLVAAMRKVFASFQFFNVGLDNGPRAFCESSGLALEDFHRLNIAADAKEGGT
jgi:hypothetical protein